jgi:hypothetical protein
MVILNFIGYFTVVLGDFSPPHAYVTFLMFMFLRFLSLCYAIPTSLLLSQDSGLVCFLLILLPAAEA